MIVLWCIKSKFEAVKFGLLATKLWLKISRMRISYSLCMNLILLIPPWECLETQCHIIAASIVKKN
jgi:hypothetical protein